MNKLYKKILSTTKNKEAKTLTGNFVWLSVLQMANYLFPLITMPYLARVIGVEGFGKIAFASAIMIWIQTVADWGFNLTATRDVAQNRDDKERISEIFSNVLWARCLLMLLSLFVLLVLIGVVPKFREEYAVILVAFLMIPGHIIFPDWFFQALERMKYVTILNVLTKLLFTICIFLFVKKQDDYILQPLFTSIGYVVSGAIALYIILNKWNVKLYRPNWKTAIQTIKKSTAVFIDNFAPNLYGTFSIILLGFWGGGLANGIFEGGNKFYHFGYNVVQIFIRTFFPFLSRNPHKHKLFVLIVMIATILLSVILWISAPYLVHVMLSDEFADAVIVVRILSISIVFSCIAMAYGQCFLIVYKQDSIVRKIAVVSSVVGFCASFPLVYYFSYVGTALTSLIGKFLVAVLSFYASKRYIKNHIN